MLKGFTEGINGSRPYSTLPACSLVGFWADKPSWCWFAVRGKHCWLADKPWLKPTSEQAGTYHQKVTVISLAIPFKPYKFVFETKTAEG